MLPINAFFNWFFFGLGGVGGWILFFLAALGAIIWVLYHSNKSQLPAVGWKFGVFLAAILSLPAITFRFTFDPTNPNLSPLMPFIEPVFYLGILSGVLPVVIAVSYFVNFYDVATYTTMVEKNIEVNKLSKSIKVFLCHASEDKPAVRQLYEKLVKKGFYVWIDEKNLLPGQSWKQEISKAVRNSDIVVICLSKKSVDKTGFVQKEIKYALDIADEKPESQIFLIPVRLEECNVPERLSEKHWVDLFAENGFNRLVNAISTKNEPQA